MEAEWITPTMIEADGIYVAKAAHEGFHAFRINIQPDYAVTEEYLLIENRQPLGFEANLWGKGLLIAHIDDAAQEQLNKGHPGQPGWPQNGNHYQVAVVPKDGDYDLERNVNFGDATDLFDVGDSLGPGMGSTVFPNTDSYQGGIITESGITINVLSQDGTDITFEVTGVGKQETFPTADTPSSPTAADSPAAAPSAGSDGGDDGPVPSLGNPVAPTMAPVEESTVDRWVLSRAPGPTRAPFDLPEFPVEEPLENALLENGSSAATALMGRGASILLSAGVCILGSLLCVVF